MMTAFVRCRIDLLAIALCTALAVPRLPSAVAEEALPAGATLVALEVFPTEIALENRFAYRQLLVTGVLESSDRVDLTRMAAIGGDTNVVTISDARLIRPAADGSGKLTISLADQSLDVPVHVSGQSADYQTSFVRDVMPAMSKLGCNAGTCHGSADGKNGFQLSLRGYDVEFDFRALTDDLAGRRFNRSAPEQSLMLLKPSGGVPHVGGVRMRPGEPHYELLQSWIAAGVQFDVDSPQVTSIEVLPKAPVVPLPGMTQQMVVLATYSDGTVRDVTAEAFIESSLAEVAEADSHGLITAVRRGEAAMLARYEGSYAAATLVVMGDRDGFTWTEPEANNFVDTLIHEKLRRMKIAPSELASDQEFLRRVYLDLTGLPPEPDEVRAFLADPRQTKVKRDELIDELIGSDAYIEHWTNKWADLLQVNRKFLGEKGAWAWRRWIRDALVNNMPYDEFVHAVLTASGSTYDNPPASYMRVLRDPHNAMENSTQLFLGIRFSCNKCHDHPFERWTQDQYYHLAAYFAQVGRKPGRSSGEEVIYDTRGHGEVEDPKRGGWATPAFPYEHEGAVPDDVSRRQQFARWVTSPENPYFAASFVNRTWSYLLGVGLIEPVDDIRAGNPPTNPELLERLTRQFIENGFDVRDLMRTICRSRAYQRSIRTNRWNEDDQINFSHAVARRLPAETLFDAIQQVTGAQKKLPGVPSGYRAVQLPDSQVEVDGGFLGLFGRPPRESACECERSSGVLLGQTLNLINGPTVAEAIAAPDNRIAQLVETTPDDTRLVGELFLAILSRSPSAEETAMGMRALAEADDRLAGAQDLAWALINSPAFLFNY